MFPTFANFVTRPPPSRIYAMLCDPRWTKRISWDPDYQDPDYHE